MINLFYSNLNIETDPKGLIEIEGLLEVQGKKCLNIEIAIEGVSH